MLNARVFLMQSCEEANSTWNQEPENQGVRRKGSLLWEEILNRKCPFRKVGTLVYQCGGLGDAPTLGVQVGGWREGLPSGKGFAPATGTACNSLSLRGCPAAEPPCPRLRPAWQLKSSDCGSQASRTPSAPSLRALSSVGSPWGQPRLSLGSLCTSGSSSLQSCFLPQPP